PNVNLNSRPHAESGQDALRHKANRTTRFGCAGAELRRPDGLCEKRLSARPKKATAELSSDESDVKEISEELPESASPARANRHDFQVSWNGQLENGGRVGGERGSHPNRCRSPAGGGYQSDHQEVA